MTLYEIGNELKDKLENIEVDEDGCVIGVEELDKVQLAFDEKVESVALYIKNQEALVKALKEEEASLKSRRLSLENKVEHLKDYIDFNLKSVGRDDFESSKCKITYRKSTRVEVPDVMALNGEYVREKTTYEADKDAIKKAIKAGIEVEGASLVESIKLNIK